MARIQRLIESGIKPQMWNSIMITNLRAELRRQGIQPRMVKPKPKPLFGSAGKAVTSKDIAVFSRQIATMMKSGVPIVMALEIIGNGQKNPKMKKLVDD